MNSYISNYGCGKISVFWFIAIRSQKILHLRYVFKILIYWQICSRSEFRFELEIPHVKYIVSQEKVNCCFQPLFSSFLPVFKKNSCYVPVLSSLPDSSCNNCFQNSYLSCYFKYILAVLSSPVWNSCTLF